MPDAFPFIHGPERCHMKEGRCFLLQDSRFQTFRNPGPTGLREKVGREGIAKLLPKQKNIRKLYPKASEG
jgi:hypothetical protein